VVTSPRLRAVAFLVALAALLAAPAAARAGKSLTDTFAESELAAAAAPTGFEETVVFSGLLDPTQVRFAPDGRVFVAQKSGLVRVFDNLSDTTPTTYTDLRSKVHDFWDRGMLGLALDPQFSSGRPYLYVMYTYDAPIGGQPPTWGDGCPSPPGPTADGCVVSARLSKIGPTGAEQVLIEDWCQQYPSHSIGTLAFGADGALYATGGDGASFNFTDYGDAGTPDNPCGDPPGGVGGSMTPPTAEGGALRSQDIRTSADPTTLDGTVIRVDPDTGAAMPDNPNAASSDPNTRRIVGYGLRNPFRFTIRPGTNDLYIGDVGWSTWEEINRLPSAAAPVENFGWPCYEGAARMPSYDSANLNLCESLYSAGSGAVRPPHYAWNHSAKVSTESCPTGGSSASALEFYDGGSFPSQYNGALFWADYTRSCVWVMFAGAGGIPDPATRQPFLSDVGVVDLQVGPGGDLFYVNYNTDAVYRIHAINANENPTAVATATPTTGAVPLNVSFDGRGSADPDGDTLGYAWDLDGDGAFDDSTSATPSFTYTTAGSVTARLRVSDPGGLTSTASVTITAGQPPTATISTPTAGTTWKVGDVIGFSGSAVNSQGASLPPSALSWRLIMHHCSALNPGACHEHQIQTFSGASGSFTAPDHEYPAYLELVLTATDGGLSDTKSRRLDPKTVDLGFETQPAGLALAVGGEQSTAPFTRTVIQGSTVSLSAPGPQTLGSTTYDFSAWSDGGARTHTVVAGTAPATYRATYAEATCAPPSGLVGAWGFDEASGSTVGDASGRANSGTIAGAARTGSGKFGSALSFDGIDDWVTVADSPSLDLSNRATVEAWVNPTSAFYWRTVLLKEQPGNLVYALYTNNDIDRPSGHLFTTADLYSSGTAQLPVNAWSHLAMTWDGTTQRLYVNGTQVASRAVGGTLPASAGALRFGGNGVWGEWFAGRLDEIRVYNRALTQAELQADAATPVSCGGAPPPAPALSVSKSSLSFTATQGGANPAAQTAEVTNTGSGSLDFTATESASWLTVAPASGSAPATLTATPSIAGLAPGTYTTAITVAAAGATGSPKTIDVTLTVAPAAPVLSVAPGSLSFTATAGAASPPAQTIDVSNSGGGTLDFTASDDQTWLGVAPSSGTAPASVTVSVATSGLSPGTYQGTVTIAAAGVSGSPKTVGVTLTVNTAPPPATGLVGAWGFEEASGTAVADSSGTGNAGTISGGVRSASGKYGSALSFDGSNDWVTVPDSATLDLTTGATVEAWVHPTAFGYWRTGIFKEQPSHLAYALYTSNDGDRPAGHLFTAGGGEQILNGPSALPLNTWSHLAMTWDGTTHRLYLNGTQVASRALSGTLVNGSGPLRFGGNSVWPEWFGGRLDEVRVYNRALTQAQLQADMNTPVGAPPQ
jgi:glucose/arabinose dehydrogenase/PKD repeat protein